jgi:hypothetical protein
MPVGAYTFIILIPMNTTAIARPDGRVSMRYMEILSCKYGGTPHL